MVEVCKTSLTTPSRPFVTGGAGGKGVWGKPGAELEDAEIDAGDPNYDSEAMDDDIQLEQVTVELTEEEIKVQW